MSQSARKAERSQDAVKYLNHGGKERPIHGTSRWSVEVGRGGVSSPSGCVRGRGGIAIQRGNGIEGIVRDGHGVKGESGQSAQREEVAREEEGEQTSARLLAPPPAPLTPRAARAGAAHQKGAMPNETAML
ncbi:MAG: hypothetical protein SGPRY_009867, partial [Prymnesium sp.]